MKTVLHPLACVDAAAELGEGVVVGPFAVIEAGARIGAGCRIGAHAVIGGGTRMGRDNVIHPGAFVGGDSQDMKFRGEAAFLEIGDRNVIREAATINRATGEGQATRIGSDCLIMAYAHVAHNCRLGDHVIMANAATLAGWIEIEDYAIVGGLAAVHQFCRIGRHAIVGGGSKVVQDVPPYVLADGHPARPYGLNVRGLRRRGFSDETVRTLKRAYRILYGAGLGIDEAAGRLRREFADSPEVSHLAEFACHSHRGLIRPRSRG